jgi:hypothetical protein
MTCSYNTGGDVGIFAGLSANRFDFSDSASKIEGSTGILLSYELLRLLLHSKLKKRGEE